MMQNSTIQGPGFWTTVSLLLGVARRRSTGRRRRQQELLSQRSGKSSATNWGAIGFLFAVVFMFLINGIAAGAFYVAVVSGERIDVEQQGNIVVSRTFLNELRKGGIFPETSIFAAEARRIAKDQGGRPEVIEQRLQTSFINHGQRIFLTEHQAGIGLKLIAKGAPFTSMLGSLVLFWWFLMLVFQGEGLELDLQRRRHPMWEWMFAHPVPPGAVFLAEMLSPIAANPIYWGSPIFAGILYGFLYSPLLGLLAVFAIGVPLSVSAACLGKACEVATLLRVAPRSRGAIIGLMSWLGYASMMAFVLGAFILGRLVTALLPVLRPFTALPWPWAKLFLGARPDGSFSFLSGMVFCWIVAGVAISVAVWFSLWGAQQGLAGNFGAADTRPSAARAGTPRFGREPLYRKEFLWFIRDRSAIVQTILIPITIGSVQMFNMRGLLMHAQNDWNYLCGAGILFGTYFLWILGPKSLASEGSALWIALTWPRGLESLLKAKAWLWSLLSSALVLIVFLYATLLFPGDIWKIALVFGAWFLFGRSMAEKSVTLVSVTSESGEPGKVPRGRRGGAQLGMLTFAIGVVTQQWNLAMVGIVYSWLTAAAMWQNFRAHLPYLYDPWSEVLPPPPTLMHAMISISILIESVALVTGIVFAIIGRGNLAVAQAIAYCLCSVAVSLGVAHFLDNRGVYNREVWQWLPYGTSEEPALQSWWQNTKNALSLSPVLAAGAGAGALLGLCARGYTAVLAHLPGTSELIHKSQQEMASDPTLHVAYFIMAVLFAPFAEEYLFRGLLFRALDREWAGWRAVLGSAAFFAIYHPPLSWLPVFSLGVANALLFKRTGRLLPAVLLHMAYNAVVLL